MQQAGGVGPEEEMLECWRGKEVILRRISRGRSKDACSSAWLLSKERWGRRRLAATPRAREAQCFAQARAALTRLLPSSPHQVPNWAVRIARLFRNHSKADRQLTAAASLARDFLVAPHAGPDLRCPRAIPSGSTWQTTGRPQRGNPSALQPTWRRPRQQDQFSPTKSFVTLADRRYQRTTVAPASI